MNSPIDRDFARMQHELRAASQDWHNPAPMPKPQPRPIASPTASTEPRDPLRLARLPRSLEASAPRITAGTNRCVRQDGCANPAHAGDDGPVQLDPPQRRRRRPPA